jgi:hypothetical protein
MAHFIKMGGLTIPRNKSLRKYQDFPFLKSNFPRPKSDFPQQLSDFLQRPSAFLNGFLLSSTAFQFSSTAFCFLRNPRKSIYGGKHTKDHYSSFVCPATHSPSFVIPTTMSTSPQQADPTKMIGPANPSSSLLPHRVPRLVH